MWAAAPIHNARCCTAPFMLHCINSDGAGGRRGAPSCSENTELLTQGNLRGPACSAQSARRLGDAANLLGVLVRLILDDPTRLVSNAQRHLGDTLVGVDHLLQAVPSQIALNRHKVLNRAAARNPAHRLNVLLHAVLDETEYPPARLPGHRAPEPCWPALQPGCSQTNGGRPLRPAGHRTGTQRGCRNYRWVFSTRTRAAPCPSGAAPRSSTG